MSRAAVLCGCITCHTMEIHGDLSQFHGWLRSAGGPGAGPSVTPPTNVGGLGIQMAPGSAGRWRGWRPGFPWGCQWSSCPSTLSGPLRGASVPEILAEAASLFYSLVPEVTESLVCILWLTSK